MADITIFVAFLAGIVSFLSPCVLPLIPGFLGYLSGRGSTGQPATRTQLFLHSVAYVLGFATIFAILGVLLNTVLAHAAHDVQAWLSRIAGLVIIVFGLHLTGLVRLPFLEGEKAIKVNDKKKGYWVSFLFGASFAVGWTPCVGPVLGSVLALAASNPSTSLALLLMYSLGLGVPFLLVGLFSSQALQLIRKYSKLLLYFNIVVGAFLIILGVLVFTQTLSLVANWSFVNNALLGGK